MGEVSLGMPALHRVHHPETWRSMCSCVSDEGRLRAAQPASPLPHTWPTRNQRGRLSWSLVAFTSYTPNCEGLKQAMARAVCQRGLGERPGRAQVAFLRHRPPQPRACPLLLWRGSHLVEHLGADDWGVKGPTHTDFKNGPNPGLPRAHSLHLLQPVPQSWEEVPALAVHQPSLGEESTLTAKLKSIKGYTNIKYWRKGVPGSFSGNANPQTLPQPASQNVSRLGLPPSCSPECGLQGPGTHALLALTSASSSSSTPLWAATQPAP